MAGESSSEPKPAMTLWMHVRKCWRDISRQRPASFYLLLAIIIVLLLGLQISEYREHPKHSAFVLICLFIFFFAAMVFSVLEAGQILRRHLKEKRDIWQSTLGDEQFLADLGKRARKNREP